MDRNLLLAFVLSMALFSAWLLWQGTQQKAERAAATAAAEQLGGETESPLDPSIGHPNRRIEEAQTKISKPVRIVMEGEPESEVEEIRTVRPWSGVLESEKVLAKFSNRGGVVTQWKLKDYFITARKEVFVDLVVPPPSVEGVFVTPFEELGYGDLSSAMYEVETASSQEVVFLLRRGPIEIRKRYGQPDQNYELEFSLEIRNRGRQTVESKFSVLLASEVNSELDFQNLSLVALVADEVEREAVGSVGMPGFLSGVFGDDEGPFKANSGIGWAGMDVQYFASLLLPAETEMTGAAFEQLDPGRAAAVRVFQTPQPIAGGEELKRTYTVFMGPKQPQLLADLGRDLSKTISLGWSWIAPLTRFFSWALQYLHGFIPNYGLVIIVLTILVRIATLPILSKQMKSSERMRELMPRIKEIQAQFKDDKQKQSEETFKLYRETGVNPLSGCFPMLVQMPVFIGLFYALQNSIELRQAPFFLWMNNLAAPETLFMIPGLDLPFRLLPLLMGGSMYAQQKMMPQSGMDPQQAKMMLIMMPGMMLFISYTFPSGLVLYWTVSNLLGIGHQLLVRKRMQEQEAE